MNSKNHATASRYTNMPNLYYHYFNFTNTIQNFQLNASLFVNCWSSSGPLTSLFNSELIRRSMSNLRNLLFSMGQIWWYLFSTPVVTVYCRTTYDKYGRQFICKLLQRVPVLLLIEYLKAKKALFKSKKSLH